jgi:hypothetical protein
MADTPCLPTVSPKLGADGFDAEQGTDRYTGRPRQQDAAFTPSASHGGIVVATEVRETTRAAHPLQLG